MSVHSVKHWGLLAMFRLPELLLKSPVSSKKEWNSGQWNSAQDEVQYIVGDPTCDIAIFSCFFTWFLVAFLPGIRI